MDRNLRNGLKDNNISIDELIDLSTSFESPTEGLKAARDYMGIAEEKPAEKLKELNKGQKDPNQLSLFEQEAAIKEGKGKTKQEETKEQLEEEAGGAPSVELPTGIPEVDPKDASIVVEGSYLNMSYEDTSENISLEQTPVRVIKNHG